jgi:hypothetical protein
MDDTSIILVLAALAGFALAAGAALRAWESWLALKREALGAARPLPTAVSARIELASLRERIRRLEAIASGIEL